MSNTLQTYGEHIEPALPTRIDIPNLEEYTDPQIIAFAANVADLYLQSDNRLDVLAQLKAEIILRIQRILLKPTTEETIAALRSNIHNIQCLMEAYVFARTGAVSQSGFAAPAHLWPNNHLEESIIEFFSNDSVTHDFNNTQMILDFIRLYNNRLTREN